MTTGGFGLERCEAQASDSGGPSLATGIGSRTDAPWETQPGDRVVRGLKMESVDRRGE